MEMSNPDTERGWKSVIDGVDYIDNFFDADWLLGFYNKIKDGFFGLVINISIPNKIRILKKKTNGYYIRRLAIDYGISVITNTKCAKLYIDSVINHFKNSIISPKTLTY